MFSSVRQGVFFHLSRRVFLLMRRKGLYRFALAQAAKALHFFSTKKRNEAKKIRRLHFFAYSGTFLR